MQGEQSQDDRKVIPITRQTNSVLAFEFRNMTELFEKEMKRMNEEMSKFSDAMHKIMTQNNGQITPLGGTGPLNRKPYESQDIFESFHKWLSSEPGSPLIQGHGKDKRFKLRFDVRGYEPADISVDTEGNLLKVCAIKKDCFPQGQKYSEYRREFLFPEGTDLSTVRSELSADGVLTIEAKAPDWICAENKDNKRLK